MKKLLSMFLVVALSLTALTGCGGGAAPAPPAQTPETPAAPAAPTTPGEPAADVQELNLAIFEGGFGRAFWDEVVGMFEADTGIVVNLQISPNIGDIIRPQIVAGNPPDFMNLSDNDETGIVQALIADRGLLDLTDVFGGPQFDSDTLLRNLIIPGFLESFKCAPYGDGRIYLAPGAAGPMGPVYNPTLFNEMGWDLPVTWDDFFALGELSKAEGIALFTYQGIHPGYIESMLFPALASALGPADYARLENLEPGMWVDPRSVAVLEQFARIYSDGHLMPGTVALNHTDSQAAHMLNEALFIPNGTWLEEEMADAARAPGFRYGITPTPVMSAGATRYVAAYTEQFSIPAGAANPEAAKLFLRYMYTDKIIEAYARLNGGAVMATVNALDMARPHITDGVYGMFGAFTEPGAAALIFGFASPPEGTRIDYMAEIFNPLSDVMTGRMTARQWAENIDQAMQDMAAGL